MAEDTDTLYFFASHYESVPSDDRFISQTVIFLKQIVHPQLLTNLVKKKGSPCGPCKASGDELRTVGQNGVTVCTGEQASAANVIQKNSSHF